ncbi:hypothetical protein AB0M38_32695 [Streptomyces sp. NPDC051742]|uniref:hypothetical protein n=1 Tax=unclassified Streptomyces TaxID=2593676 RepID=UPI003423C2E4
MSSAHITRHRLGTAVTTVLAVTLGAGLLAVPATAAPTAPGAFAAAEAEAATPIADPGGTLLGAGRTGFLTRNHIGPERYKLRWTTYADGTTTTLPATDLTRSEVFSTENSDILTWAYLGTGNTTAPFTRVTTDLYAGEGTKFNSVS